MYTLLLDSNHDLYIDNKSSLAHSNMQSIESIKQVAQQYASTLLGEMMHQQYRGLPFLDIVANDIYAIKYRETLKERLELIPGVESVDDIEIVFINDLLNYSLTLRTSVGFIRFEGATVSR